MSARNLSKEVESQVLVRFPDCDSFGHLNNSKYIDYIINAREDQLVKYYDFNAYKIAAETGNAWVVAQTQIAYVIAAELMETLTIRTRLLFYSEKYLIVEAIMYNESKTQLKAVMWTKLAHYNLKERKSCEHSLELMEFFKEVYYPIHNNLTYEERVKSLKQINQSK